MKHLINYLTRNWLAKLISLIIAVIAWFLINSQVEEDSPRLYRDTLHKDSWTD